MEENVVLRQIIDHDVVTGEEISRRIVKMKEQNKYHKNDSILVETKDKFYKVSSNRALKFTRDSYYRYFHLLGQCLTHNSNAYCYIKNQRRKTMTPEDIMEFLDIKRDAFNRFIAESIKLGYIARVKTAKHTYFIVNPAYNMNGRYISSTLFDLFKSNVDFIEYLSNSIAYGVKIKFGEDLFELKREANEKRKGEVK